MMYNKYRNQERGVIKLNIDKEDIEWFLSLIVTIWLGVRKSPKTKEPQKRKRRKRK